MAYDENIYAKIVSGEITSQEIEQLKSTGEWEEIQMILQATDELELTPLDKQAGYETLLKKRESPTSKKGSIKWLIPIASAAAVTLLLIGFFYFNRELPKKVSAQNNQTIELSIDNKIAVTLNDGSTLEYNDIKNNKTNTVQLNGEAFFEVVSGNHLIVETQHGKIEVLGTKFNVRTWGKKLSVQCFEGRVMVRSKNEQTELQKMEAISMTNNKLNQKSSINHTSSNWLNGNSRIKQETLSEVFNELERQYNITIKRPDLDQLFSGEFPHNNLTKALDDVCLPMGLTYKIIKPNFVEIYE